MKILKSAAAALLGLILFGTGFLALAAPACATAGKNQNVYVSNSTASDFYVMAAPNPNWAVADLGLDAALFATGLGELRAGVAVADLPTTISTFSDLYKVMSISAKVVSGTLSTGTRSAEAAKTLIELFKTDFPKNLLGSGRTVDAMSSGFLSMYMSASGIGGMLGASTVTLMIMSKDGSKVAKFNTPPDQSWIIQDGGVASAKYGTLWQQSSYYFQRWA